MDPFPAIPHPAVSSSLCALLPVQLIVKRILLQNTREALIPLKGEPFRIAFQHGFDMGVYGKSLDMMESKETDTVCHLGPHAAELQKLCLCLFIAESGKPVQIHFFFTI